MVNNYFQVTVDLCTSSFFSSPCETKRVRHCEREVAGGGGSRRWHAIESIYQRYATCLDNQLPVIVRRPAKHT